jgi:transcriptional regulator with XRE-family HTH domain
VSGAVTLEEVLPAIGMRLRAFRKLQRQRLKDLAEAAQCSESLLSRVENGLVMPSLSTLHRLCRALGVSVAELLQAPQDAVCVVYPPGRRPRTSHPGRAEGDGSAAESLVPYAPDRRLEALLVTLPADGAWCGPFRHDGEEVGLVLEGALELVVETERHVVGTQASFFFRSDRPHRYRAAPGAPCRVVWINTPPTF